MTVATWTIDAYTLHWSLTTADGSTIDTLELKPILHGDHARIIEAYTDDDDRLIQLLSASCGVAASTLEELRRPDYNSLAMRIAELVTQDAAHFMEEARAAHQNPDAPELLLPITVNGEKITSVTLSVPTLKASRLMTKCKTAYERAEFITAHCTGLMLPDLALLSVPDWNTLQERINDFLNEPADSFQTAI